VANNIEIKDGSGALRTVKTTDTASVHTPHHNAQLRVGGSDVSAANPVPVGGLSKNVSGSLTRPNDANVYAAGDAVTDSTTSPAQITFSGCARVNGGSGVVLGALLVDSASQSTKGSFELWLFDAPVTPDNDNAAFTPADAELATLVGVIPFNSPFVGDATAGAGGNCVYDVTGLDLPFVCGGGSQSLFGLLVVRNAYTPVALEDFTVRLRIAQD